MSQTFTKAREDSVMSKTNPVLVIMELTVSHWGQIKNKNRNYYNRW